MEASDPRISISAWPSTSTVTVHWPAFGFPPPTIAARCGIDCAAATAASAIAKLKIRLYIVITLNQMVARCSPFGGSGGHWRN